MNRIFTFLLLLTIGSFTNAQWVQTNGPCGARVISFAQTPNGSGGTNLFAGILSNGIYLSTNNGLFWKSVNNNLADTTITFFAGDGLNLFAGTSDGHLYRLPNNGTNWIDITIGLAILRVNALIVKGTNIFLSVVDIDGYFKLFTSKNNGTTWDLAGSTPPYNILDFATDGINLFAGTSSGVYLSTNDGLSWTTVNSDLNSFPVNSLICNGNTISAGTDGGFFISTDSGMTWLQNNSGLKSVTINKLIRSGSNIFAGTKGGVYLSTNNGNNWVEVNSGITNYYITSLAINGTSIFAGTYGNGVYLSSNNGAEWNTKNLGLPFAIVNAFTVYGTALYAGAAWGIYRSTNNGKDWTSSCLGRESSYIYALAVCGVNIFAGSNDGLFCSVDSGKTWNIVNTGIPFVLPYASALAVKGSNIYAATLGKGVIISTDYGKSWYMSGLTNIYIYSIAVNGSNIFAGTNSGIYLSTDDGISWNSVNSGLTNTQILAITVCGNKVFVGNSAGVYVFSYASLDWTFGNKSNWVYSLAASDSNLFAGTDIGVYLTTNNGISWTDVNEGLIKSFINVLTVCGNNLFAAVSDYGIYRRPLSEMITLIKEIPLYKTPSSFSLKQNYPNPWNPTTTINYSLALAGNVKLTVYNSIGSKVATIVNEYKTAGNYSVQFNGSKLTSGIYLYRLESGNYSAAKKFVLMK